MSRALWYRRLGLVALAGLLLAGLLQLFDGWLFGQLRHGPDLVLMRVWSEIAYWAGQGWVQMLFGALLAFAAWRLENPQAARCGLVAVLAVFVAGSLVQAIKYLTGRPRPRMGLEWWHWMGPTLNQDFHSFPSGHAATSFALAAVLTHRFPRSGWLFYLLAALVAAGRVFGRSHYPSDVVGGALLGLLVGWVLNRWTQPAPGRPHGP